MGRKVKAAAGNAVVPQDDAQAGTMIRDLGEQNREDLRLQAAMNDRLPGVTIGSDGEDFTFEAELIETA